MLDRFTDRARRVMSLAKEEALAQNSTKVGTEHLLLALAKEQEGIAAEALRSLDISYDDILTQLKEIRTTVPDEEQPAEAAKLAFTPRVISVMERSFRLARENNQTYVSTEHLLLGVVDESDGMGMDILQRLGVSAAAVRGAVDKLTSKDRGASAPWRARHPVVPALACRSSRASRRAPTTRTPARSPSSARTSPRRRARASSTRSSGARRRSPA